MAVLTHILSILVAAAVAVRCSPAPSSNQTQPRAAQGCADPTLAQEYIAGFNAQDSYHVFSPEWDFINDMTTNGAPWVLQGPAFRAWPTLPPSSTPMVALWQFASSDKTERVLVVGGADGPAPRADGYSAELIRGYAYATPVCGSVWLLGLTQEAKGDFYYTASQVKNESLIARGWQEFGTLNVAYVLPV